MEKDTLDVYLGKVVVVSTTRHQGAHPSIMGCPTYVGRLAGYDHDFVTLSPHVLSTGDARQYDVDFNIVMEANPSSIEKPNKNPITLGRRTIDFIQEVFPKQSKTK